MGFSIIFDTEINKSRSVTQSTNTEVIQHHMQWYQKVTVKIVGDEPFNSRIFALIKFILFLFKTKNFQNEIYWGGDAAPLTPPQFQWP